MVFLFINFATIQFFSPEAKKCHSTTLRNCFVFSFCTQKLSCFALYFYEKENEILQQKHSWSESKLTKKKKFMETFPLHAKSTNKKTNEHRWKILKIFSYFFKRNVIILFDVFVSAVHNMTGIYPLEYHCNFDQRRHFLILYMQKGRIFFFHSFPKGMDSSDALVLENCPYISFEQRRHQTI